MNNENFIQAIRDNYIDILKDSICDKQKEIKRNQILIIILILIFFITTIFHFWNYKYFIAHNFATIKTQKVIINE